MNAQPLTSIRELHRRDGDGLLVRLLWNKDDDRATVAVLDTKTRAAFTIEVREDERPMDVFEHPFAYAAWRGIPTDAPKPAAAIAA